MEIQKGAVAKSYMTNGLLMTKYLRISSYIRKPFLIYDFATAPIRISLNMEIFFISAGFGNEVRVELFLGLYFGILKEYLGGNFILRQRE
jgi:hypothetical protein